MANKVVHKVSLLLTTPFFLPTFSGHPKTSKEEEGQEALLSS